MYMLLRSGCQPHDRVRVHMYVSHGYKPHGRRCLKLQVAVTTVFTLLITLCLSCCRAQSDTASLPHRTAEPMADWPPPKLLSPVLSRRQVNVKRVLKENQITFKRLISALPL